MTLTLPVRGTAGRAVRAPATRSRGALGTATLVRFALRRDRVRLPVWIAAIAGMVAAQAVASQDLYDTPEKLASLVRSMTGNAAVVALGGRPEHIVSIGAEVAFEIYVTSAVLAALMSAFTVVRHSRGDEEAGRTELLRSATLGRLAPVLAALVVALAADLAVAVTVAAVAAGTGLPLTGSLVLGASIGGVGAVFAAAAAVAAQCLEHARGALGLAGAAVALAFVVRAAGDIGGNGLSWASPLGWGQAMRPWGLDRWWPLAPCAVAVVVLGLVALRLAARRDLGAGLVQPRPGRATAPPSLSSVSGLAWRLHRTALAGWASSALVVAAFFGSMVPAVADLVEDNPAMLDFLPGGAQDVTNAYLALSLSMYAVLAAAFSVSVVLHARAEETAGRAEPVLATATSRTSWFGSHLAVAFGGGAALLLLSGAVTAVVAVVGGAEVAGPVDTIVATLAYVPATAVVTAAAALLVAAVPRASAGAWALIGYSVVSSFFVQSFHWPTWVQTASPVDHVPRGPFEAFRWAPVVVLAVIAVVLATGAFMAMARRDVGSG